MENRTRPGSLTRAGLEPVFLPVAPDPVLAFLHRPEPGHSRDTAVLLCPPFGWEELCSYRPRRRWAEALAQAGWPAARIDLPGAGDSGGRPEDPGRLEAWTAAVDGAARWLLETTGCGRLATIGIGLGGMLAYRAAAEGAPIDDLILWAVPSHGRALLRGLQAHSDIVASRYPADSRTTPEGDLHLTGFPLSGETASALERLDLTALTLPPSKERRILLLSRDGLTVDKRLREHVVRASATVEVASGSDYNQMMGPPEDAEIPHATIAKTISWLRAGPSAPRATPAGGAPPPVRAGASMWLSRGGKAICERPLRFDLTRGEQIGILSEPAGGDPASVCAVFFSVGVNRTWVEIARAWAARGVPTVRIDLDDVGDSDERQSVPMLYAPEHVVDARAVLDQLDGHDLPGRYVLVGLCAAAYWALHTAVTDTRVAGALMINLYSFYWDDALSAEHETRQLLGALRHDVWRRLRERDVNGGQLVRGSRVLVASALPSGARRAARRTRARPLDGTLDKLRDQGAETLLLLSEEAALYDQFGQDGLIGALERWPNLRLERIPSRDHMFRAPWLQRFVHERLDRALDRVLDRVAAQPHLLPR